MVNNKINTFGNNEIKRKPMNHTKCPNNLESYSVELFLVNIKQNYCCITY